MMDETMTDDEIDVKELLIKGTYVNELYADRVIFMNETDGEDN